MTKEKRILSYILGWFLVGYIIFVIGTNNVFAATYYTNYGYNQQYYDNNGSSVTSVTTTWNESLQSYVSNNITTVANSYGAGLSITSPIPLITNHTYTLSVYFENINNIALSSKNNISVGNDLYGASYNYANNNYWADMVQSSVNNNSVLQFVFTVKGSANYIFIPWTTTTTVSQSYVLTQINMEDLGSEGISQNDINNSLNNQTNIINDSIQNSTDTIINNQNQNNEELKDTINDNFNSCRDSYNLLYTPYTVDNKLTDTAIRDDYFNSLNYYVTLQAGKTYTFSVETDGNYGSTTGTDTVEIIFLKGTNFTYFIPMGSNPFTFIPQETGDFYIRYDINQIGKTHSFWNFQIVEGSSAKKWEQAGIEVCTNKIDETNDKIDETNQNLGDIKDSLTDSSPTDMSDLGNSAGWLPAGPVDSILTLPLTMLNSLVSNLSNNSCQTISVELPFVKENITLPCVRSLYDKMGVTGTLFTTAGLIASAFILFNYLLALYKWVDDTLTMRENTMPGYFDDNWGGGA